MSKNLIKITTICCILILTSFSLKITTKYTFSHLSTIDLNSIRQEQLQKHNQLRARHGCPALSLDQNLNNIAQQYSENLFQNIHSLEHSNKAKNGDYGQNLYWSWASWDKPYVGGTASQSWYDEIKDYNYDTFKTNTPGEMVGHFTAMIWKSAKTVGFGIVGGYQNDGYAIYVTANYSPVTNVIGRYAENVPRPTSSSTSNSQSSSSPIQSQKPSNQEYYGEQNQWQDYYGSYYDEYY